MRTRWGPHCIQLKDVKGPNKPVRGPPQEVQIDQKSHQKRHEATGKEDLNLPNVFAWGLYPMLHRPNSGLTHMPAISYKSLGFSHNSVGFSYKSLGGSYKSLGFCLSIRRILLQILSFASLSSFFLCFWHLGGFQVFGGVPGEDFDMQNPNLRSTMMENSLQRWKKRKIDILKFFMFSLFCFIMIFLFLGGRRKASGVRCIPLWDPICLTMSASPTAQV